MTDSTTGSASKPTLWKTRALLEKRRMLPGRPERYEDLLLEPIVDAIDDPAAQARSYPYWEQHHAHARRFYLAGLNWFLDTFNAQQKTLDDNRHEAHRRVASVTTWTTMRDPKGYWRSELGRPQVLNATAGEPMAFAKGAQLLMTCEIIAEQALKERHESEEAARERGIRLPDDFDKPEHIHRYMGLLPACWNIANFNEHYVGKVKSAYRNDPHAEIADAIGLKSAYAVAELTRGHTVTRLVAEEIRRVAAEKYSIADVPIGHVRAQPGVKVLGRKSATHQEGVELY